jgi:hypothetical protein
VHHHDLIGSLDYTIQWCKNTYNTVTIEKKGIKHGGVFSGKRRRNIQGVSIHRKNGGCVALGRCKQQVGFVLKARQQSL